MSRLIYKYHGELAAIKYNFITSVKIFTNGLCNFDLKELY